MHSPQVFSDHFHYHPHWKAKTAVWKCLALSTGSLQSEEPTAPASQDSHNYMTTKVLHQNNMVVFLKIFLLSG